MYGTLEKQTASSAAAAAAAASDQQQQQVSSSSCVSGDAGGQAEFSASSESKALADQESRRRKRIYSHCHVQSVSPDGTRRPGAADLVDKSARRRLIAASIICLIFMIGEVVGGVLSNSLAIATDAAHLLTDFASFMISLFAIWLSSRPASRKMSFGWYRAEVIGALVSVLMIWLVTGLLVYMAVERLRTREFEIDSLVMVITAASGLLVNIIMAIALNVDGSHSHGHFHAHHSHHGHRAHSHQEHIDEKCDDHEYGNNYGSHHHHDQQQQRLVAPPVLHSERKQEKDFIVTMATGGEGGGALADTSLGCDSSSSSSSTTGACDKKLTNKRRHESNGRGRMNINVRAAFIHVIGDFLQSLGVLIAALVIHFEPEYAIVDPICTFLFSIIVLITTINIIRDATNVLMEGIPDGINFIEVREKLQSLPFVIRVHNLRIWSLSLDKIAISSHLVIDSAKMTPSQALKEAIETLRRDYNFFEVTIQIEEFKDDMKDCEHCQEEEVAITINSKSN